MEEQRTTTEKATRVEDVGKGQGGGGDKPQSKSEVSASPDNSISLQTVSDDDEVDYSFEPEFYDPHLDDIDESWFERKRHGHATDAVLSCPACFTTLCLECQRHEMYVTQYRAIFVVNCKVETEHVLHEKSRTRPERVKRRRHSAPSTGEVGAISSSSSRESFKRVCCSVCSTEVGVMDEEEVYHFHSVLPSEA